MPITKLYCTSCKKTTIHNEFPIGDFCECGNQTTLVHNGMKITLSDYRNRIKKFKLGIVLIILIVMSFVGMGLILYNTLKQ